MAIITTGTVRYAARPEASENKFDKGPDGQPLFNKFSVAITPDDPSVPKLTDKGLLYVNMTTRNDDIAYLRSLQEGDRVTTVFDKHWSLIVPTGWESERYVEPASPVPVKQETIGQVGGYPPPLSTSTLQYWMPMNSGQVATYLAIVTEKSELLLTALQRVQEKATEYRVELEPEILWKLAVTAHIDASREFHKGLMLMEDEDEEDEEPAVAKPPF